MTAPRLIQIGVIGAAHGVRGETRVKSFTEDPTSLGAYGPLSDAEGGRSFRIASLRPLKDDMLVVRFEGVATREAAEALNGVGLFARRDALPPTEAEDDFYHADLIGLSVETLSGEAVGKIVSVQNFGADDLLEIRLTGRARSVLLPFTRAAVPVVDVAGGRVVVDPPEGALDEAAEESRGTSR
ncbi:ribosome maturation factor RimM [Hansschlegelia zhihuaiae]|uniref:Ribosome maturation factor RimM n=1 Tax=Hansschlegelia zhihuaiae TaxID=405005 RepID=A0A4Q0MHS2_9HYPH|nr:ribosome maturation factor RimM [Hansschlegelia zhihuaiae]RXF73137.1 ribosome maturation factor RimM [Hansschlegelia zhihuaiae]